MMLLFHALTCLPAVWNWENMKMAVHETAEELFCVSHIDVSPSDMELNLILGIEVRVQHVVAAAANKPRQN
jgi:hypothetical protein